MNVDLENSDPSPSTSPSFHPESSTSNPILHVKNTFLISKSKGKQPLKKTATKASVKSVKNENVNEEQISSDEEQIPSLKSSDKAKKNKKKRARNFTTEEISIIMKEANRSTRVLKQGRFGPAVSKQIQEEKWQEIANMLNRISGYNDRTWDGVRKKFHDVESSARTKSRAHVLERQSTGGGQSSAPPLNAMETIAMESIPQSVIVGLTAGFDSNMPPKTSSPNTEKPTSAATPFCDLLRESRDVLLPPDTRSAGSSDSEISFDITNPSFEPDPVFTTLMIDLELQQSLQPDEQTLQSNSSPPQPQTG